MNVTEIILTKLTEAFDPDSLEVRNVSHRHAGHAGSPGSGQSHFEVEMTSAAFEGVAKVARHRKVYQVLAEEMAGPIHALNLDLKTPAEDTE